MWPAYIDATSSGLGADDEMVFDRFNIAQHVSRALEEVRRAENKLQRAEGDEPLWLGVALLAHVVLLVDLKQVAANDQGSASYPAPPAQRVGLLRSSRHQRRRQGPELTYRGHPETTLRIQEPG